eukprot:Cvel_35394.t2-p1 / transcript=Cvel_35394.t2 / gene=Cvel_35394 / organism=Chromera_velia_CCMP2878 / gene_product=Putative inactive phenolphthiocerol synthesis, putative / transcript_product=Putative inactive phenolphthiocerol synthesis, putative / location=Cvel_scaffold6455:1-2906(-) / protein_length=968 / sequence_SO=supercontig / SO=protein_coding / is_pseudo=false
MSEVPLSRWNNEAVYDPDPDTKGTTYVREAAFIEDVELFDNGFFSISAAEAKTMDPQQRHMLEVAYEALSHAGESRETLVGSSTGVFIGCCQNDWQSLGVKSGQSSALASTGGSSAVLSNRISYAFGLTGPSMTIDTACSSSLVALHGAQQGLRGGSCDLAIVGGVNLMLGPFVFISFCKARMLSPGGRCKTFDASADGYARGEGAGAVVLQRVADVRAQKKAVFAVVRGAAVNHVGRAASLTAPNGPSQQEVIRCALRDGGVEASDVCFVEAHGTGTALGDPIEVGALKAVYAEGREAANPLVVGALKTSIGHLEGAAGIAGFIKLVLVLQHRSAPPNLRLKQLNPHLDIEGFPVVFPTEAVALGGMGGATSSLRHRKLIGGVSSFGFGGANAHVVVEEGDERLESAWEESLSSETTQQGVSQVPRRRIAFLFTGQGSQYVGMCRGLYETEKEFRCVIDRCDKVLRQEAVWGEGESLTGFLFPSTEAEAREAEKKIHQTVYAQPALYAVEVALYELWRSRGVMPDVVMGHSLGEYAASVASGVLSIEDGLLLVSQRARLMQETPSNDGVMVACRVSEAEAKEAINTVRHRLCGKGDSATAVRVADVSVAAVNGPRSVVLAGPRSAVEVVLSELGLSGPGKALFLSVSHAFHSPLMRPVRDRFGSVLSAIIANRRLTKPQCDGVQMVSTVTGACVSAEDLREPEHWLSQIERPVRFAEAVRTCVQTLECSIIVELGPKPVLTRMGRACITSREPQRSTLKWMSSSDGTPADTRTFEAAAAEILDVCPSTNISVTDEWTAEKRTPVMWQKYAFPFSRLSHPLVGRARKETEDARVYETALRRDVHQLIEGHRVMGKVLMPGAGFIELMGAHVSLGLESETVGAQDKVSLGPVCLSRVEIEQPLVLPPSDSAEFASVRNVTIRVSVNAENEVIVASRHGLPGEELEEREDEWAVHSRASFEDLSEGESLT